MTRLKEDIRDKQQELIAGGKWYPPSYRWWVKIQAAQGDRVIMSQLKSWDYRDRHEGRSRMTTTDRRVVLYESGGTPVYDSTGDLEARPQKNGSVRFRDRRMGESVCTDYGDRVASCNHHDCNALADKPDLTASILFGRDPRMGFEPEGNDKRFNQVFTKVVVWHNVTGHTGHEDYRITQPDVGHRREGSKYYYRNYTVTSSNDDALLSPPEQDKHWEPSPLD